MASNASVDKHSRINLRIYLDTNIWNISCDQRVDPEKLLEQLDRRGCTPVVGIHAIFELIKTFHSNTDGSAQRAKELLGHLEGYLSAGLRCVAKDVYDCITAEMCSINRTPGGEKFIDSQSLTNLTAEVYRLAHGEVKPDWMTHVSNQVKQAEADRSQHREHFQKNPEMAQQFKNISSERLASWLEGQCFTPLGQNVLKNRLVAYFVQVPRTELATWASQLLWGRQRMASALVRGELYYNWRCAHRASNPPDLLDDMYHVLNSAYCYAYATSERKQVEYFEPLLGKNAELHIFPGDRSVSDWLIELAELRA